jgi:hypothetical protein
MPAASLHEGLGHVLLTEQQMPYVVDCTWQHQIERFIHAMWMGLLIWCWVVQHTVWRTDALATAQGWLVHSCLANSRRSGVSWDIG